MRTRDWLDLTIGLLMLAAMVLAAGFLHLSWWPATVMLVAYILLVASVIVRLRGRRGR
jgi:hypothetical protein